LEEAVRRAVAVLCKWEGEGGREGGREGGLVGGVGGVVEMEIDNRKIDMHTGKEMVFLSRFEFRPRNVPWV
jgi:hypothetical protein